MSWRDHIKVHPAADLFPMMSESELRELGEDIKENGQSVQVVLWKDPSPGGEYWLIDGRNRLDAIELAGLCVFDKIGRQKFFWRLMDGDPYEVVLSLNLLRRNLTDEQRRELIGKIIKAEPEASNVTIAKETGTSEPTVRRVRNGLSSSGDEVDQRTGRAAARPQAKKPRPKPEPKPVEYRATGSEEVDIEQRRAEYAALDAEPPRPVTDLDSRIIRAAGAIRHEAMGLTRSDTERFLAAIRDQIASIEREVLQDVDAAPSDLAALRPLYPQKRTSLPLSAHTMPRKQIREGHQRPSSSRRGVLASLIRIKGRVVNLI